VVSEARNRFGLEDNWNWTALERRLERADDRRALAVLCEAVSLDRARDLFLALSALEKPEEIAELRNLMAQQEAWGGGFHGLLPTPLPDEEIPIPSDLSGLIRCAAVLAAARQANLTALAERIPSYPLEFEDASLEAAVSEAAPPVPAGWSLTLDLSGIRALLALFEKTAVTPQEAAAVAALPAFTEMIRHRRALGYVPEPLITAEGLAAFLARAASREPLDRVWKWLTPQNFFDLADLYEHRTAYAGLVKALAKNAEGIVQRILGTIGRFAPLDIVFIDRLSFAVGWGIAGWATDATGGLNIEHFKDDFDRLFLTLTHETFHRFQLVACPADPTAMRRNFEALASFPFESELDRKFYEVLAYLFLEGTATFVAAVHPPADREALIRRGEKLLYDCGQAIYEDRDLERAEELLNEGLRSNGPFYWYGAHLAGKIVKRDGNVGLARTLASGGPDFVCHALASRGKAGDPVVCEVVKRAKRLVGRMRDAGN